MDLSELKRKFIRFYGSGEIRTFHSPGKINLIGDQVGYDGGLVLACALEFGTFACVRKREDKIVNLISTNFDLRVSLNLDDIIYHKEEDWTNYPKGVMKIMQAEGYRVGGMDILVSGNAPRGIELSSSTSLQVLVAVIINDLFNESKIDRVELVKIIQKAEKEFLGINGRVVDCFTVGTGKKNKAIFFNCDTLEYKYVNAKLGIYDLIVISGNNNIGLNGNREHEKNIECYDGLNIIKSKKDIRFLSELSVKDFEELEDFIGNEHVRNTIKHIAYENERVREAYECLEKGEVHKFGNIITESHNSLRKLYKIEETDIDIIVEECLKTKWCIGARMVGAELGCCAIALVNKIFVKRFMRKVAEEYAKRTGYEPSFQISSIGEGAMKCD